MKISIELDETEIKLLKYVLLNPDLKELDKPVNRAAELLILNNHTEELHDRLSMEVERAKKFPPLNPEYSQHDVELYLRWLIAKVAYNSTILMEDNRWVKEIHEYIKKSPDFISEQLFEALNEYKAMKVNNPATSENVEDVLTFKYSQLTGCSSNEAKNFVKNWRYEVLKQLTNTQTLPKLNF